MVLAFRWNKVQIILENQIHVHKTVGSFYLYFSSIQHFGIRKKYIDHTEEKRSYVDTADSS